MKLSKNVSSSRSKSRKAHFTASSAARRKIMSSPLSKELREKYKVRSLPIHKDDTVLIVRGSHKGREGRVTQVYRMKYAVWVDKVSREKGNGQSVPVDLAASNLVITDVKLDEHRKAYIKRRGGVDAE